MKADRRAFLRTVGGAAGFMILPRRLLAASGELPPSETVYAVCVGVGGMGRGNMDAFKRYGKIIGLADVDPRQLGHAKNIAPDAKTFVDYREMYDALGKDFDAVVVATPDHWHALPAMEAMQRGKHVYLEKPLARTVWETRKLMEGAARYNVVTQMGNQGRSFQSNAVFAAWVQRGVLGRITEVHTWITMRLMDSKRHLPELANRHDIPDGLDWERWVGPAQFHPYNHGFMPGNWRAWTPFGCGTPGDWGCHLVDPIFTALKLQPPKTIHAEVTPGWDPKADALTFANASRVRFEYELANKRMMTLLWHDGEFCNDVPRPPMLEADRDLGNRLAPNWTAGAVVYGTENTLTYGSHGASGCRVIPEEKMRDLQQTKALGDYNTLGIGDHHRDFVNAIKSGRKASSDFSVAGVVTEAALLGTIAIRNPGVKLEWDAHAMRITNCPEANALVIPEYRKGYELKV